MSTDSEEVWDPCGLKAAWAKTGRKVGPETAKTYKEKFNNGFWEKYCSGPNMLEIGHDGGLGCETVFPHAIGIDKNYPGYNGVLLPFADASQDTVYASHIFEHVDDWRTVLQEWYRVLKIGGYLIIIVPHVWLYEKKPDLPSEYNPDHKRFYTPGHLLLEVFEALPHLGYRVRHCIDNDTDWNDGWTRVSTQGSDGLDYTGQLLHSHGCYEIELVLEKTSIPDWTNIAFGNRKTLGRS